ncbi:FAD:protein FMN transferase [Paenibacillus chondroitinus]|uniref:FAD:protein FMN transferase n=1 Tax=Paenibacillus chondroitinus TaxID=59842 RepID=A0ABU6DJK3_9BACL|nr:MULTISPECIES: FAD:protein FMN transferase [Paenibacillus]MCY9659601.1 FAD:protein FMN transferase [Paenibacillus anseongense]MEB4796997.1 FAD:protein FMN transferase [Paenibacillus chondroitinus]
MEPFAPSFHSFHFQSLKAEIELLLRCEDKERTLITQLTDDWFRNVDKRFSPALADSEISLLNTLAGENCMVSNTMLEVLFLAEMYQAVTDGYYNPLHAEGAQAASLLEWEVDPSMKSIKLPHNANIHLRGLEQSWAVKRLAEYMQKQLSLEQGLILAGGEITVWGRSSLGIDPWIIGIQNPWQANTKLGAIALPEGSLSTYSQFEDPSAGSVHDVVQCTVAGEDLVECQVWARTLARLGVHEGLALLAKRTSVCEAVVITAEQELHYFGKKASLQRRWLDMRIDHYHFQDKVS